MINTILTPLARRPWTKDLLAYIAFGLIAMGLILMPSPYDAKPWMVASVVVGVVIMGAVLRLKTLIALQHRVKRLLSIADWVEENFANATEAKKEALEDYINWLDFHLGTLFKVDYLTMYDDFNETFKRVGVSDEDINTLYGWYFPSDD